MITMKSRLHLPIVCLWFVLCCALFLIPENADQYGKTAAAGFQSQAEMLAAGSKLFTPTCDNGYCHGKDGTGGNAPPLRGKNLAADYLLRVISNGISGTPMPAFKNSYSQKEIQQLAAYVAWLSKYDAKTALPTLPKASDSAPTDAKPPVNIGDSSASKETANPVKESSATALRGDAQAGQAIFFDSANEKSCRACHTIQGRGGKLGPDLSNLGNKTARQLFQLVVIPHTNVAANFATLALTTKSGERIVGIKREEDDEAIKIYDTSTLPPVSRTFQKSDIAKTEQTSASIMPNDYASRYTLKQLLDLIAFLKSSDLAAKANVTLKDLFDQ
jgi:putative heme-binding domain-containing protein